MVCHWAHKLIFNQLIINSATKQLYFNKEYYPSDLFADPKGLFFSNTDKYSYQGGGAVFYKINYVTKTLVESKGIFLHYSMFLEEPFEGYAKYLSPGECALGGFNRLKKENGIFDVDGRLMIMQPKDSNSSLYDAMN